MNPDPSDVKVTGFLEELIVRRGGLNLVNIPVGDADELFRNHVKAWAVMD